MNLARPFFTITNCLTLSVIVCVLSSCASSPRSQDLSAGLEIIDLSTTIDGDSYTCKVIVNTSAKRGGAAILFLHGSGECGIDGEKMLTVGLPKHAMETPERWPFVMVVPQKPTMDSEWEDHERAVLTMLDQAAAQRLIDPDRVGITGLSQGGHGTIALASRHPDRFVAAAPVCAYVGRYWDNEGKFQKPEQPAANTLVVQTAAAAMSELPTWIHHGDSDVVVSVEHSRALFAALYTRGSDVRYSEYKGVNHNSWDNAYTDEVFAAWFETLLNE